MGDEIELVSDGDGLVVVGAQSAVERFLQQAGLLPHAARFSMARLSAMLRTGAELAETASEIAEKSAFFYLKLTPESVERIREAGGLMKTKTEGISHAMIGDPGNIGGWLQVEDGPAALLTVPRCCRVLAGLSARWPSRPRRKTSRPFLSGSTRNSTMSAEANATPFSPGCKARRRRSPKPGPCASTVATPRRCGRR